ncbi:leucine-rich repeat receptor protein kinase HPCA1-like [Impatiens glandulifera]|uniref:leucine-rich repeat receptor protein kinase HPCA1-like n=1 Tax=Impatiens glandulifera TaxID=253017 RepID=UPI001FB06DE0|nr:leucine-rich repeat receptor protein kinase HPCA1-like [Impatiens glandulifera]
MGSRELFFLVLLSFLTCLVLVASETNNLDVTSLKALMDGWKNVPPNWVGTDPCGSHWIGIGCTGASITSITLASLSLSGTLSGDIASLSGLTKLDLSYNKGLTGSLPQSIGSLKNLTILCLIGCSFSGPIPDTIGSLPQLSTLSLNRNSFTGRIPSSIGNLKSLYWLDLAENQLTGPLPVSDGTTSGLDQLVNAKHFHLDKNQFTGEIPPQLFAPNMKLIHVLLEFNQLTGSIPSTIGLLQHLEVLRLDGNILTGDVPSNISSLTSVGQLDLSNNQLTGSIPDLGRMTILNTLDLSNNSFQASAFPSWYSNLPSLTTLHMQSTQLEGEVPPNLFTLPQLQTVILRNNQLNGTLNLTSNPSSQLKLVDLRDNKIDSFIERPGVNHVILARNPVCIGEEKLYCRDVQLDHPSYTSESNNCISSTCKVDQTSSPNCLCAYPYTGNLYFRAPTFSDLGNSTIYKILEHSMNVSFTELGLPVDSISLSNPIRNSDKYLELRLEIFPSSAENFNCTGISSIGFVMSNQTFKPPHMFGPYFFIPFTYDHFPGGSNKSVNVAVIIGVVVGGSILVLLAIFIGFYALRQRKRAVKADKKNNPFSSWGSSKDKSGGDIPQLKGARAFSFGEVKKYTNNFSKANDIGSGGYGIVYKGTLPNGHLLAIKRAQKGSMQGAVEFKSEIELLSRVHHKNVVGLVGFCFDQGEQMLVYEYIPNGTLKESLLGKSGIMLDWSRRLRIALGAARGLHYLHELANPPIIHRDIKSNNILLDERLNAKVADFGLSKAMGDSEQTHISTQVKGTMGYMDPEYYMTQHLTDKSDVYSFGVLLLEIVTAKQPIDKGKYIVREVRQRMDKTKVLYDIHELIDPTLLGLTLNGLEKFVEIAMRCVADTAAERPTMGEVVKEIEGVAQMAGMNPNAESSTTSENYEGSSQAFSHPYSDESLSVYK